MTEFKTNFKGPRVTEKQRRRRKREARDKRTRDNKQDVRTRDLKVTQRGCRFPRCGCHRFNASVNRAIEVSHLTHQGMGGNPKEDRNTPDKMIAICGHRHKDGRIAIDKGTLECRPLTPRGTDGPVAWWASVEDLANPNVELELGDTIDGWVLLARELAPGVLLPTSARQDEALEFLSEMEF